MKPRVHILAKYCTDGARGTLLIIHSTHSLAFITVEDFFLIIFQIRSKQEHDLKARNFLPPQAADPEMFVIDGRADPARTNGQLSDSPEGEPALIYMKPQLILKANVWMLRRYRCCAEANVLKFIQPNISSHSELMNSIKIPGFMASARCHARLGLARRQGTEY